MILQKIKRLSWPLLLFFIVYGFINQVTLVVVRRVTSYYTKSSFEVEETSLSKKDKEIFFQKKIAEARNLFRIEPNLKSEPDYKVNVGDKNYQARFYDNKVIEITEGLAKDFTLDELAGVIAHELAHVEEVERVGFERRPHWMVDVRAAEIAGRQRVVSAVEKLVKKRLSVLAVLSEHPFLFYLTLNYRSSGRYFDKDGRPRSLKEIYEEDKKRLEHLYALRD
ncbi:MAG: hypothetical protein A3B91_04865 [Candidatus Yanofskybacteria bacterium RIFCSPHIGHO2_02_FULL_41_29]|uniref:Peptidase M48 domain-containing protein n=1 Tax=Candidatus Yanofskybacteria bacterium RIFCSPHIGHO2_01_FULL_41_53 TaxID=1802663 RepID=A0A1F8EHV3_9BACT|nr:MAG: hypothetical protein A2650_01475 [Candidatus Yanofskybacteria bacterium RIFCSPHIGHO2_01_FULL_41_53]OGN11152.1 MAG: hypothetical protein A3B91_04865 [Candidatus Yanofskybacteria bacterium RIFCSPHIGHO2_02_FULL_41_29]OGN16819.1 MAG: hypothetical protein A3F48_04165 [Candidatus Yanofskybacteria bacterium RIFCSPHIGHO2_12_FULL_41_9]OGN22066.1 MAG: hypothetical protein A2916_00085 [Candidatus Yanofskybacteria bacterium RIFCSPLOWO2_01_FULL_41_67]OGN28519.1 MAG: hypothetical protein A3H54_04645 